MLPVLELLPDLKKALAQHPIVLLEAPPGAGKSTVLPLELLDEDWLAGQQLLLLEPRRLAARTVAARLAQLKGESPGQTVGYRVRFESQVSQQTRLEVVTEGILVRRLQRDAGLEGVGLIIFDEFHERGLQADLALALCREVQAVLRPELRLLVMSATLEAETLSAALGGAPVLRSMGRQFPVEKHYLERDLQGAWPAGVAGQVSRILAQETGDVLVFLPGMAEIGQVQKLLQPRHPEVEVLGLYGDLDLAQQQRTLLPIPGRRKVVLATSIAETSLTIEGVRVVVDGGLARLPRFDARSGLTRLETVRVTADAAEQRAGRAGRLEPGVAYRLWSLATQAQLLPQRRPEVLEADLTGVVLELAQWGVYQPGDLSWVSPPPVGAWQQATRLLAELGALVEGRLSPHGRQLLDWATHPRLAHLLIEGQRRGLGSLAADLAALLEERDPLPRQVGADLGLRLEALQQWRQTGQVWHEASHSVLARVERLAATWRGQLGIGVGRYDPHGDQVGLLLALAYPDRIGQQREGQRLRYRLSGGRGAVIQPDDPLQASGWLAVAQLDAGQEEGRIYLAAPVNPGDLLPLATLQEVVGWDRRSDSLLARREERLGQLVLRSEPLPALSPALRSQVVVQRIREEGLGRLPWTPAVQQWRARLLSLACWRPSEGWPDLADAALLIALEDWLAPWLTGVNRGADLAQLDLMAALQHWVPYAWQQQLKVLAPEKLGVPSGREHSLTYFADGSPPVLAVKLQEVFGLLETPRINQGRTPVLLHLLSPAMRPVQVTQDLHSFWLNGYPELRKELRGRYPRHPWPDDPLTATPTARPKPRTQGGSKP